MKIDILPIPDVSQQDIEEEAPIGTSLMVDEEQEEI